MDSLSSLGDSADPADPAPPEPAPAGGGGTTAARPATYQDIISAMAKKQGIDPRLALAVAQTESNFNPAAKSPKGALGIMQLMPETASRLGVDPNDPIQNIQGGIAELKRLSDEHQGDVVMMLRRYNGSPQASTQATDPYVKTVLDALAGKPRLASRPPATTFKVGGKDAAKNAKALGAPPPPTLPTYGEGKIPNPASTEDRAAGQQWDAAHPYVSGARDLAVSAGKTIYAGFDPTTQTGRRNLAGMAGAGAAGFAAGGVGMVPALAGAAGAALFSGTEVATERALTGQGESADAFKEAGMQAGANLAGSALMWPVQAIGRRVLASTVGKNAAASLSTTRQGVMDSLDVALETAKTHARDVKLASTRALRSASRTAKADVLKTEAGAATKVAAAEGPYQAALAAAPPNRAIGQKVGQVVTGPAKSTKDAIGAAVGEAAESGPDVPVEPLRAEISRLMEQITPAAAEGVPAMSMKGMDLPPEMAKKILASNPGLAAELPKDHPLPGLLARVQGVLGDRDTLPFADAHKLKRLLDETVNWESPAKKQVQQVTKSLRQTLRDQMAVHEPYNAATARYAEISPLFNKGYGKQIQREALEEPGRFIGRISTKAPEQAKMLRELLVDLPAEQGPEAAKQGMAAWNNVRSAWTYDKVIKGGVEKMGDRIANLPPEFAQEFYGDQSGQRVLSNLKQIHQAYTTAVDAGKIAVEQTKAKGVAAVDAARASGEAARSGEAQALQDLRRTKQLATKPTTKELAFLNSSVNPKQTKDPAALITDALRVAAIGPTSFTGGSALLRLIKGPAWEDLAEWAAYSPGGTQALVRVFTEDSPGRALANLYRVYTGNEAPMPVGPPPDGRTMPGAEQLLAAPPPRATALR